MLDFKDKNILIFGLGVSGYASAKFLLKKGYSVKISEAGSDECIKSRINTLSGYDVEYESGGHTAAFCREADISIVSPGINVDNLVSSGILSKEAFVIGTLELGFLFCAAPIIAITGTNGKSTVTELIGKIIISSGRHSVVCGNIGNPLIGEVDSLTKECIAVVEVSSFQLETIGEFKPYVAVLLNVTEDHYDRHGGFDEYKRNKFQVFKNQTEDDWSVLCSDLKSDLIGKELAGKTLFFGKSEVSAEVSGEKVFINRGNSEKKLIVLESEIVLRGTHNLVNIACAVLVADILGIDMSVIIDAVKTFQGLGHRFELIGSFQGIDFIDDSKATNIDATRCALGSLEKKAVLVAGGIDKGGDYSSISGLIKNKVKAIIAIGEAGDKIKGIFESIVPVFFASGMGDAVNMATEKARKGDVVILSPMCSSFDMFSGYKERGEVFQREVFRISGARVETPNDT